MPISPALLGILQGALSGAGEEVKKEVSRKFKEAQKGSLKMLLVFQDPEGKVIHFRLGMSKRETQEACREVFKQIREEGKRG